MDSFWEWVGAHRDALGVVMTAVGLLAAWVGIAIAAVYARLTHRLAATARQQADFTQALLERGHRPWLYISAKYDRRSRAHENSLSSDVEEIRQQDFAVALENKGSVPAIITTWRVVVQRDPDEPRARTSQPGIETAVYPNGILNLTKIDIEDRWKRVKLTQEDSQVVYEGGQDPRDVANSPVWLKARVTYRGVTEKPYVTEAIYNVGAETDFMLVCREVRFQ